MRRITHLMVPVTATMLMVGCAEDRVGAVEPTPVADVKVVETASAQPTADEGPGHGKKGRKKGRNRVTPVYVDGELVASLRFSELPSSLPVTWQSHDNGNVLRRFAFGDYLTALGIDLDEVKALHLYGGRRTAGIDGDELRAKADKIRFQFSRGTAGRPQYRHDGPVASTASIDKIKSVAIYINKPVPELVRSKAVVDGEVVKGMPYADGQKTGGTRVYVDGRITTHLKRRHAADAEGLAAVLRAQGVDLDAVKSATIVSRDKVVSQLSGAELGATKLTLKETKKGRIAIEQVADGQAIDAIVLIVNAKVVDRTGPAPDELKLPGLRPVVDDARQDNKQAPAKKGS